MGKLGPQCCAFGCSKRRKSVKGDLLRSDSEGSTDDESGLKRKLPGTFHKYTARNITDLLQVDEFTWLTQTVNRLYQPGKFVKPRQT